MKRALTTALAVVAFGAVMWLYFQPANDTPPGVASDAPEVIRPTTTAAAPESAQPTDSKSTALSLVQPAPPTDVRPATIRRLADGDSFDIDWLDTDERDEVRLVGINAPEGDACYGQAARQVLDVLINDQQLQVETIERDEFGRILGNVWTVDGTFINATMVELGAALALSDGGRHGALITDAQDVARTSAAGLWASDTCGSNTGAVVQIGWIEANAPGPDHENKNGEYIVIENAGDTPADMTDWSIRDESTRHRYYFPDGHTIAVGDSTTVFSGCGNDSQHELYWCDDDPVWNNGGDTGFLVDPDGRFADSLSYSG